MSLTQLLFLHAEPPGTVLPEAQEHLFDHMPVAGSARPPKLMIDSILFPCNI